MAAHESSRTIKLYDRTNDEVSLDEVELSQLVLTTGCGWKQYERPAGAILLSRWVILNRDNCAHNHRTRAASDEVPSNFVDGRATTFARQLDAFRQLPRDGGRDRAADREL